MLWRRYGREEIDVWEEASGVAEKGGVSYGLDPVNRSSLVAIYHSDNEFAHLQRY